MPPRFTSTVWIPTEITNASPAVQTSGICKLSSELIGLIGKELSLPDIVSLGLSCKQLAVESLAMREHRTRLARAEKEQQWTIEADREAAAGNNAEAEHLRRIQNNRLANEARTRANWGTKTQGSRESITKATFGVVLLREKAVYLHQCHSFFDLSTHSLCYGCIKFVRRENMDAERPMSLIGVGTPKWVNDCWNELHKAGPRCKTCAGQ